MATLPTSSSGPSHITFDSSDSTPSLRQSESSSSLLSSGNALSDSTELVESQAALHSWTSKHLLVPLAIWDGPTNHEITAICFLPITTPNRRDIATGSSSGQICIWSFENQQLTPRIILVGHRTAITALTVANYNGIQALLSVSSNGTLYIWDPNEGSCLTSLFNLFSCSPTTLVTLPNGHHVAAAGRSVDIELLDTTTLKVEPFLRGNTDWVASLYACPQPATDPHTSSPDLVSLSHDNIYRLWSSGAETELPIQTTCLSAIGGPVCASLSADKHMVLVVLSNEWLLMTAGTPRELLRVTAPGGVATALAGGRFVGPADEYVLIWKEDRSAFLYGIAKYAAVARSDAAVVVALDAATAPTALTPLAMYGSGTCGPAEPARRLFQCVADVDNDMLVFGSPDGSVAVWDLNIPANSDPSNSRAVHEPKAHCNLLQYWRASTGSRSVATASVTASLVIKESLTLVRGYDDGRLTFDPLPYADDAVGPVAVRTAHTGRVTSLMYYQRSAAKGYVVSGGADGAIRVWDSATCELVYTFSEHTAAVTSLFRPEQASTVDSGVWKGSFVSISRDKSVGLFSLDNMICKRMFGGHPAPVSRIAWRLDQDYLIVGCDDGSVSIWEIGTGQLESVVYGQTAADILEACDDPSLNPTASSGHAADPPKRKPSSGAGKRGIASFTVATAAGSPIQVLEIDVKMLLKHLAEELATNQPANPSNQLSTVATTGSLNAVAATPSPMSTAATTKRPHSSASDLLALTKEKGTKLRNFLSTKISIGTPKKVPSSSAVPDTAPAASEKKPSAPPAAVPATTVPPKSDSFKHYKVYSYLLPWQLDPLLDRSFIDELMLKPPAHPLCYALTSHKALAIFVPSPGAASPLATPSRWTSSSALSAVHTLAAVTVTKAMLSLTDKKNICSQLLSFLCTTLPDTLPGFKHPSLSLVGNFWNDTVEDVMTSARSIFSSTVDRMPPDALKLVASRWSAQLAAAVAGKASMASRKLPTLLLGIIGSEKPEVLDDDTARRVAKELQWLLQAHQPQWTVAALELLGKGYAAWKPHVAEPVSLLRTLFSMTLPASPKPVAAAASTALLSIGAAEPRHFVAAIGEDLLQPSYAPQIHAVALATLAAGVKKHPLPLLPQLPRLVEAVVRAISPTVGNMRKNNIEVATQVVLVLVNRYPMVSFHHDTQRLAVGTANGAILVYDLVAAAQSYVLDAVHRSAVTAVAFASHGKYMASYSVEDGQVACWNTGASLLSGVFGATPQCIKTFTVSKPTRPVSPMALLDSVKLQWPTANSLLLSRGWEPPITFSI